MRTVWKVGLGLAAGAAVFGVARLTRWRGTWGMDPGEAERSLPGDDIVADVVGTETRGITIAAPPEAVWPWLVQMGYGRAGWYSWDQLDQRGSSATEIVDEWQTLSVGDVMPTHPGGGFDVAVLEPGRALVLRSDTDLVMAQAKAAQEHAEELGPTSPGVQASAAILKSTPQEFSASWAFVLEPTADGGTRLIERFRAWFGTGTPGSAMVMPLLGFGVFVMMQKQMTGIKARAEGLAERRPATAIDRQPAPDGEAGTGAPTDPELVGSPS
jgi:hypothetical protein